jgi:KDO2-lipid IV(A) lauroyltransferase
METVGYYIFYGITWTITLLPLRFLYLLSDLMFFPVYYFPGYRRKVVRTNLLNTFPEKSFEEIIEIERKFYHHFCDLFIETFKLLHLSLEQLVKRIPMTNPDLLKKLESEDRDVVAILGHYGNWEWLISLPYHCGLNFVSIYKPLQNKHFDKFMIDTRSRFGMTLTPMHMVVREIIENKKRKNPSVYSFLADQTPPANELKYWTRFLNQDTPVYLGAEKIASKYDMAVIFFNIRKIRRGNYTVTVEMLFENTAGLPEHKITETHVKRMDEIIRENPQYWIWSHRRWKHKRANPDG